MGIQGLIPFLQKSSRPINVSQYSGCSVAIDAYCWLHKGAFSCSDKLARGDKTDMYVTYCMKYVNMLLSHNIKPILVFDGRHLPAKAGTEKKRRENRELNKRRAAELLRQDKPNEARTYLQRCVDVTHEMALELMQECRRRNVDCITAPYEADAQLAYLNINNFAHIVITEDSDLLLFGCTKVIFKLDVNGNGLLVEQERLHLSMGVTAGYFSLDKFRHMCILSGCDYLPSLPKIGLAKALRFVKSTVDPDIHRALSRLGGHLNMNINVPVEYRDKFLEAEAMFCHQPVFDLNSRLFVPLTPLPPGAPPLPLLSEEPLSPDQQLQLALGNLHPFTLKLIDDWSPDSKARGGKTSSWSAHSVAPHKSIWSPDYKPRALVIERQDSCKVQHTPTSGKVLERSTNLPVKRPLQDNEEKINSLRSQFGYSQPAAKKQRCKDEDIQDVLELLDKPDLTPPKPTAVQIDDDLLESPKKHHVNPFSKSTPNVANKFSGISKLAQFKKTEVNSRDIVRSRYFWSEGNKSTEQTEEKPLDNPLKDVGNVIKTQTENNEKSPFETKSSERLTDDSINSILTDTTADLVKTKSPAKQSKQKENFLNSSLNSNRSFKWKPSLADMFGFKSKSLPSSPAIKGSFVSPLSTKAEETPSSPPCEQTPVRRNPFAKVTKAEDACSDIDSQGDSFRDSQPDSLTSDVSDCQASHLIAVTPQPPLKVGLSKKQNNSCQKSLLSMFAFKPKAKLQR